MTLADVQRLQYQFEKSLEERPPLIDVRSSLKEIQKTL